MDAKKIAAECKSALAAFEDVSLSTAAEIAQWTLLEIWRGHTDDPADIALIEGIEIRLNPHLLIDRVDGDDLGKGEPSPLLAI